MTFIDIPTEQTTALTDLIVGLIAIGVFVSLYRVAGSPSSTRTKIWLYAFGLLAFVSFIGTAAHGLMMSAESRFLLWQPINLALGLVIAMFVCATVFDLWGAATYRKVRMPMIGVAVVFYIITVLIPGTFLTFVAYEAVAMLFALAGYAYLAARNRMVGAVWMVAGILITILASGVQASGQDGVVIFLGLDHNGVFHLIQIFGILALAIGIHKSLEKSPAKLRQAAA